MGSFAYKLRTTEGRLERGVVQALSTTDAVQKVHKLGGVTLEVKAVVEKKPFRLNLHRRLPLKEKIVFTEQLAVMLNAGITLVQALKGLRDESSNTHLKDILNGVIIDVEGGIPFSDALAKYPKEFSRIYQQMIRSAEKTGNVADILTKLTTQQQKEYELKGKVRGALLYPAIVFLLLIGVIIIIITFILPRLTGLFADSGVSLPLSTKILIGLSNLFVHQWYLLIGGLVAMIVGLRMYGRTEHGRYVLDALKIRVPILGNFVRKSYMAHFAQSFASLSQAGVPVLEAFTILEGVVDNAVYQREIKNIAADVANGIKVSTAIRKSKYFPGMIGQLVSVGEQSGDLSGVFTMLGEFFEKEVDGIAKNLSTILEPLIMVVMGAGVGFVLVSVLQPIFNLTNSV